MSNELLRQELLPEERILWSGAPEPKILFNFTDIYLIPFSLLWGGFAIFWEYNAVMIGIKQKTAFNIPFVLFGSFFVVIGLYMIFGRFIYKYLDKKNTVYGITNKRVIVIRTLSGKSVQAVYMEKIDTVNKSNGLSGFGSITFGGQPLAYGMYSNSGWPMAFMGGQAAPPAFYDVADVDRVYDMYQKARRDIAGMG